MTDLYYQVRGEVVGPVPLAELKQKVEDGEIERDTLVREGADGQWVAASDVHGLFDSPVDEIEVPQLEERAESLLLVEAEAGEVSQQVAEEEPSVRRSPLALRPCADCGALVSGQADTCPNCGRLFHGSSPVVQYRGEHPIPVLAVFAGLAIVFLLAAPLAVYGIAISVASKLMESDGASSTLALVVAGAYLVSMVLCAFLGRAVGAPRMARITGLLLGLFFGPLGVFAAFAIDKRPQCCQCCSRLDGFARECPYCHARLIWKAGPAWY